MNATATFALDAPDRSGHYGRRGLSLGWGASLLVHAAILAWLLQAPAPRAPAAAPGKRIEVRLAAPSAPLPPATAEPVTPRAPAAPARPDASAAPARTRPAPAARAPAPAPARAPAPAYATRPAPATDIPDTNVQAGAPAAASAPADAPSESASAPVVDMAGARAAARLIAREQGKSLVALPARKPVVDPNAGRAAPIDPIEAARKSDCKSAYAGAGLLAIIPLAASAVMDTGCKW